ncbi:MAG: ATP-binding cassette domain-containing protein [Saprospiraceae bacterium]|nr:ATP-binding cassette domain-containing protein [Saprospiraceae bacterium]
MGIDRIECEAIGKRYMYEWVIRDFDFTFRTGECYAIKGPNGSGKSTLLKILSGHATPSAGTIRFMSSGKSLPVSDIYNQITYTAPYIDLIEELTVKELLKLHDGLRSLDNPAEVHHCIESLPFKNMMGKKIGELSSGMKQRIKLILAIHTRTSIILLDEPGTNLDEEGKQWFENLLRPKLTDHIVIIASNEESDLNLTGPSLLVTDYKTKRNNIQSNG